MLREKMQAVIQEVNEEIAEREELIECIAIALLTKKNLFILGDTGQAKSYAINQFRKRIEGAKQYERLLSKQTDEEALFGRIDLQSLIQGHPRMITTGKIPDSHIVFLDEIFKSNEGVLNSLLTALNERRYTNESETVNIPAITFFSASNEIPNFSDPAERILKPLYDRFDLKVVTEYIESREKRLDMLAKKQNTTLQPDICCSITLSELGDMQEEVRNITVPVAINELMDDILCELRRQGIHVSDRKYLNYAPIPCAKAWLSGRTTVQSMDLLTLKNYLWVTAEERITIEKVLEKLCINPIQEKLKDLDCMAQECADEFFKDPPSPKSFSKFRKELLRVYDMMVDLLDKDTNPNEATVIDQAIARLDDISRTAHEKANFTYLPLSELKLLS